MEILESIFLSKIGGFLVMGLVVFLFIGLLRFLYGPKGIWRKNLWDGIPDDETQNASLEEKETHLK